MSLSDPFVCPNGVDLQAAAEAYAMTQGHINPGKRVARRFQDDARLVVEAALGTTHPAERETTTEIESKGGAVNWGSHEIVTLGMIPNRVERFVSAWRPLAP